MPSRALEPILDILVPTRCLGCRSWQPVGDLGLCRRCRSALMETDRRRCSTCAQTLAVAPRPGGTARCMRCTKTAPGFSRLFTLYAYEPPLDAVIKTMKFGRRPYLAELFADDMWDRWAERLVRVEMVIPVPMPWSRRWLRGYNQAEVLARRLAGHLGLPLGQPLRRRRGPPQSLQDDLAARRRNVRRSLDLRRAWRRVSHLRSRNRLPPHVLLVDDVMTSGATLRRCAQLLRRAGAREVLCAAIAHRPAPHTAGARRTQPRNVLRRKRVVQASSSNTTARRGFKP